MNQRGTNFADVVVCIKSNLNCVSTRISGGGGGGQAVGKALC